MESLALFLLIINILSFFGYGLGCLFLPRMNLEFVRYGLPRLRVPTGISQIGLSTLLILGLKDLRLIVIGTLAFTIMMLLAMIVRIKIKDSLLQTTPALLYFALNVALFVYHLQLLTNQ